MFRVLPILPMHKQEPTTHYVYSYHPLKIDPSKETFKESKLLVQLYPTSSFVRLPCRCPFLVSFRKQFVSWRRLPCKFLVRGLVLLHVRHVLGTAQGSERAGGPLGCRELGWPKVLRCHCPRKVPL